MQSYISNGIIVTESLDKNLAEAGTICLVLLHDHYYRITITRINSNGNFIVQGDYNGEINKARSLYKITVLTNEGHIPLRLADWKEVITKELYGTKTLVEIVPYTFIEGKYVRVCSNCNRHFVGGKKQSYCQPCCTGSLFVAKLKIKHNGSNID